MAQEPKIEPFGEIVDISFLDDGQVGVHLHHQVLPFEVVIGLLLVHQCVGIVELSVKPLFHILDFFLLESFEDLRG